MWGPRIKGSRYSGRHFIPGSGGVRWWARSSEWNLWVVSCLLTYLHTDCFLPVCNLVLWHFPSPSSLAGFEAGLCSSEGPHLSAPRWLLLLSDLRQLHCYQSRKITGPLRSNREQKFDGEPGTSQGLSLRGLLHPFWWIMHELAQSCQPSWSASSYGTSDPNKEGTEVASWPWS